MDEPESVIALILLAAAVAFLGLTVTMVMAFVAAWRIRKEVTAAREGRPMPTSVLPLAKMNAVTIGHAADYEVLLDEVQRLIETGKTKYSSLQLQAGREAIGKVMRFNILIRRHKVLVVVLFMLCVAFIPVGIVSVVILSLVLVVASMQARRVEEIVNEYYRGELVPARQLPASSSPGGGISDELAKLHALRQQGVLSEEEFQRAKAKVVG